MNSKLAVIGGSVLGLAVGTVAGYFIARERWVKHFEELLETEIENTKNYYDLLYKKGDYATPASVLQRRVPAKPQGVSDEEVVEPPTELLERVVSGLKNGKGPKPKHKGVQTVNIFDNKTEDDGDHAEEDAARGPETPYILDVDEFMNTEVGYQQVTLTYFAEDHVLADENEMPMEDIEASVGNSNLDRFGYRSKDPNVVYIRNERLELDFEVCLSKGSYAKEVGGFVEHQDTRPRKFRKD